MTKLSVKEIVEACAEAGHEAKRLYDIAVGEPAAPPWRDASEIDRSAARVAVPGALAGASHAQSHLVWWEEYILAGVENHEAMVPFADLSPHYRSKVDLYLNAVRTLAAALGLWAEPVIVDEPAAHRSPLDEPEPAPELSVESESEVAPVIEQSIPDGGPAAALGTAELPQVAIQVGGAAAALGESPTPAAAPAAVDAATSSESVDEVAPAAAEPVGGPPAALAPMSAVPIAIHVGGAPAALGEVVAPAPAALGEAVEAPPAGGPAAATAAAEPPQHAIQVGGASAALGDAPAAVLGEIVDPASATPESTDASTEEHAADKGSSE